MSNVSFCSHYVSVNGLKFVNVLPVTGRLWRSRSVKAILHKDGKSILLHGHLRSLKLFLSEIAGRSDITGTIINHDEFIKAFDILDLVNPMQAVW